VAVVAELLELVQATGVQVARAVVVLILELAVRQQQVLHKVMQVVLVQSMLEPMR
jgi:hypothetical protein